MHQDRSHGRADRRPDFEHRNEATSEECDTAIDLVVLVLVLHRHPAQLTVAELQREIVEDQRSFAQTDAIERAVRDLTGAGLLHRHGQFAIPTRAALRFDALVNHEGSL
jgi:hypothetical protein